MSRRGRIGGVDAVRVSGDKSPGWGSIDIGLVLLGGGNLGGTFADFAFDSGDEMLRANSSDTLAMSFGLVSLWMSFG